MREKLFPTQTLLGTSIYAYDEGDEIKDEKITKVFNIVHCDSRGAEKFLRQLRYRPVKEVTENAILRGEIDRTAYIFEEGMREGQRILKHGFEKDVE